jgi:hypothetical protein
MSYKIFESRLESRGFGDCHCRRRRGAPGPSKTVTKISFNENLPHTKAKPVAEKPAGSRQNTSSKHIYGGGAR